ncbi:hypothetical protein PIB30_047603 [Stylosanthes scabra]|uniref:Ubiquitin-like protease family profile domain-containing protein n=1 Tax=Stylosanthes scabra TaxID=79078 RepID=A0ABU6QGH7_9FABA|nr:hypothetical protein [Stylosanthes scabra]
MARSTKSGKDIEGKNQNKSRKQSSPKKKDQGHHFRCLPKTVATTMYNECFRKDVEKIALIEELGFGAFSHLPCYNLKQHMLKELVNIYDIHDNTIHSVRGDVEITTDKIGKALGLSWNGDPFDDKSNILDQLLTWAGRGSMFKKGHTCLMPMYINIPQQPNEYDCAIFVMKWMEELDPTILRDCHDETREHNIPPWNSAELEKFREKIVSNILLGPENSMRMDVVTEVNKIRLIKPGATLRSPFTQLDSTDLKTN